MKRFAFRLFAAVMLLSPAALAEKTPPASVVVHGEIDIGITWEVYLRLSFWLSAAHDKH